MSRLTRYIRRGIRYVLHGQPIVENKVVAEVVTLAPSELLKGRTALITGGTSGIGKAIAEAFVKAGANVIITSRSQERADEAAEEIVKKCALGSVIGFAMDMTSIANIKEEFIQIRQLIGSQQIDILVNNAGVGYGQVSEDEELEFDTIMATNLKGPYFLSKKVAKYMVENGIKGNILNICSSSSLRPGVQPYTFSKWGMRSFTLGLAKQLIPYGIIVNGLAPGPTISGMTSKTEDDIYKADSPIKRWALPVEIANMAVMLVGNGCRTVVGDILYMTGGAGVITNDDMSYKL